MAHNAIPVDVRVEHLPTDEWCVLVDGRETVTFGGPDAEARAKLCLTEIRVQLRFARAPEKPPTTH